LNLNLLGKTFVSGNWRKLQAMNYVDVHQSILEFIKLDVAYLSVSPFLSKKILK